MEFFPDGVHVRLQNRVTRRYLHADEDGVDVSQRRRRASLNAAWAAHRVLSNGVTCVLLRSAAYGRYLALAPAPGPPGYRVVLRDHDEPELVAVMWMGVRAPSGVRGDVLLRHVTNHHVRAKGRFRRWHTGVTVDFFTWSNMTHWMVEAIPPRLEPPVLPAPTPQNLGGHRSLFHCHAEPLVERTRIIRCFGPNDLGNLDQLGAFQFNGRSVFILRNEVARRLGEENESITVCSRAGVYGRLTPLVIDLPDSDEDMDIVVLATGSPAAEALRHPDVDAP